MREEIKVLKDLLSALKAGDNVNEEFEGLKACLQNIDDLLAEGGWSGDSYNTACAVQEAIKSYEDGVWTAAVNLTDETWWLQKSVEKFEDESAQVQNIQSW